MKNSLMKNLNANQLTLIYYPALSFFLFLRFVSKDPVKGWWNVFKNHVATHDPVSFNLVVSLAIVAVMAMGYLYFKLIFSNYWSSSAFLVLLAIFDWRLALGVIFLLFITVLISLYLHSPVSKNNLNSKESDRNVMSRGDHHFFDVGNSSRSVQDFGEDYAIGKATGVGFNASSMAGRSTRDDGI